MTNYIDLLNPFFDNMFNVKNMNKNVMATDIVENPDSYILYIDLPSVDKQDVKISLKDERLTVSVSKENKIEDIHYLLKERNNNKMSRTYYVGSKVKYEDISATLEKGVLTLTILKSKEDNKERFVQII